MNCSCEKPTPDVDTKTSELFSLTCKTCKKLIKELVDKHLNQQTPKDQ